MPALDPITAIANLVNTVVQVSAKETTECGKECRSKCKAETGWLFGGRAECKRQCKKDCLDKLSPEEQDAQRLQDEKEQRTTRIFVILGIILLLVGIGAALYLLLRKK